MKYAFIREHYRDHSVLTLCRVMGVSTSGYYDWYARPASHREQTNRRLLTKIQCFHKASRSIYGSPRIHKDLQRKIGQALFKKKQAFYVFRMRHRFISNTRRPAMMSIWLNTRIAAFFSQFLPSVVTN